MDHVGQIWQKLSPHSIGKIYNTVPYKFYAPILSLISFEFLQNI